VSDPESLFAAGWRQGAILHAPMPLRYVTVEDGEIREPVEVHDDWILVTQDCDLAWGAIIGKEDFFVELRPILLSEDSLEWGLRGHRFRVHEDGRHIDNRTPRLMATPAAVAAATLVEKLDDERVRGLKTWLGKRYDRPALPAEFVELARKICEVVERKKNRAIALAVRDILATFETADDGQVLYTLVAVLPVSSSDNQQLRADVEVWLSGVSLDVPKELGILETGDVMATDEVGLDLVENSYSMEVSKLTWPVNSPHSVGEE
jgi:hypothetical protein